MMTMRKLSGLRGTRLGVVLVFAFCGLMATNGVWAQQDVRGRFLVEKIYDYNNSLLAEYAYDGDNHLIKRVITDTIVETNRTIESRWEEVFEYENGRVSKIKTHHLYVNNRPAGSSKQESNWEVTFEYDSEGRPKGERAFLYENGLLVSTYGYTFGPYFYRDTLKYDQSKNVSEYVYVGPKSNMIEEFIEGTYRISTTHYEYDGHPKPNFGLDYLFVYEPLPLQGTINEIQKGISKNNMVSDGNHTWIYTYNEYGLPVTIETRWKDITPLEPVLLRLTYKQIEETDLPEVAQEMDKISVYPNPVRDKFWVECKSLGRVTIYDMLGKKMLSQDVRGRAEIDVSRLPAGIYNVVVSSGDGGIRNGKIVKQL